jgi:hypothetical protein
VLCTYVEDYARVCHEGRLQAAEGLSRVEAVPLQVERDLHSAAARVCRYFSVGRRQESSYMDGSMDLGDVIC